MAGEKAARECAFFLLGCIVVEVHRRRLYVEARGARQDIAQLCATKKKPSIRITPANHHPALMVGAPFGRI